MINFLVEESIEDEGVEDEDVTQEDEITKDFEGLQDDDYYFLWNV
jgi:hypothetical protein